MARQYLDLARIYGAVDQSRANEQAIKNNELQNQRYQRQMQIEDAELARQEGIRNAYRGAYEVDETGAPKLNRKKALSSLYGVDALEAAKAEEGFAKRDAEAAKMERENKKAELADKVERIKAAKDIVATTYDQNSYNQAKQMLSQIAPDLPMPEQWTPEWKENTVMTGEGFLKKAEAELNRGVTMRGQDITMRGQDLSRDTTLRGQDLSAATARRGQDITASNAAQRLAFDRSGGVAAVNATSASGKPVKLTEDQGKATGWLSQANNAYGNMKSVMVNEDGTVNKDVVKPGMFEAGLSNIGMEGTANGVRGAKRQQFVQATESMSEALLRAATGAGVNKDEARQKARELLPQWTDSDDLVKQKLEAIPVYLDSLKVRAGAGANTLTNNQAPLEIKLPDGQKPRGQSNKLPVPIKSDNDYNKLPKGTLFKAPDGSIRVKP
jgi:hypothetical protein